MNVLQVEMEVHDRLEIADAQITSLIVCREYN